MRCFDVELKIHFPFQVNIPARSKEEAVKKAVDQAMDYLEAIVQDSRRFAEFWEYDVKSDVISISDIKEGLKR